MINIIVIKKYYKLAKKNMLNVNKKNQLKIAQSGFTRSKSDCVKRKRRQQELQKDLTIDQSGPCTIIKEKKRRIAIEYERIKSIDFLRVKRRCQLMIRLKAIKNIMEFFHLFIFGISYPLASNLRFP